ncbi:MAG: aspartate-semialdehyde dehydrogenase [Nitrospirae bacterium]|nr:MAG: aspartate-semialdehyde dehydrogenase [Nitrospirota bacterium]
MLEKKERYNVAVVGATGAVGQEMLSILAERDFPVGELRALASERSVGKEVEFGRRKVKVELLTAEAFEGIDIALFSAGAARSKEFAPKAVEAGAVVVDNSSAFRMDPEIPLIVPEVNRRALPERPGIIANPNCSTIQMVVALKPIHDVARIKRIVVATYQAVSGAGGRAMEELMDQVRALANFQHPTPEVFPHQIAFNVIPHIDVFFDSGYTKEEMKMVNETRKILADDSIRVTATCVRVPVFRGHSEAINVETERKITADQAREILAYAEGVTVYDHPQDLVYPMPFEASGHDDVLVGRIREDPSVENGLDLWVVSDNLRKGAALNAVQIAEELIPGGRERGNAAAERARR